MATTKAVSAPRNVELTNPPAPKPKRSHKPVKLRASITPGTILILVAGRFRGHRVVFLKQLPSGLLLVNGPHKINGVPLKRVNQAYVIATTTKVDISGVQIPQINESIFKKTQKKKNKDIFAGEQPKKEVSAERKKLQSDIDAQLLTQIKKVPNLRSYLKSFFTLRKGQSPHNMKF